MPEQTIPQADFWDCNEDQDRLLYREMNDAVEDFLDSHLEEGLLLGETIEVFAWERVKLAPGSWPDSVLEDFLCNLDENYGDPDDYTEPTDKMKEAAQTFVEAILAEYQPWSCEPCGSVKIDVTEWVKKNRPDWLEGRTDA